MISKRPDVEVFNQDATSNTGYLYTTNTNLSSQLATQRTIDLILQTGCFANRSILDLGCGDGFYTIKFWDQGKPGAMVGIDAASKALEVANRNKEDRPNKFPRRKRRSILSGLFSQGYAASSGEFNPARLNLLRRISIIYPFQIMPSTLCLFKVYCTTILTRWMSFGKALESRPKF